ncbi:hypothetical protein H9Q72_012498 [Fusarium xylarioides]|uniref:Dynamin-type G domain-containing protein n=1 Tax=Fusarium xylarioides TaxID=221167 RepID=A0A9P7KZN3_9HYPO|nr:hypothetical protein H9Q72_012498 [Fusarium xylarioides]
MADPNLANGGTNGTNHHGPMSMDTKILSRDESRMIKNKASLFEEPNQQRTKLFDLITRLRRYNVEEHFGIPQIVMCGYQSTGKSSVLEAITEIPFPTGVGMKTKCVTEVTVCGSESEQDAIEVTIEPSRDVRDKGNSEERSQRLKAFQGKANRLEEIGALLHSAEETICEDREPDGVVTRDIVRVRISSCRYKNPLQLYDLPGLVGTDNGNHAQEDIKKMMIEYVEKPNTIIIAVVRANGDTTGAETSVLKDMCQKYDPDGERSFCILTHPDESKDRTGQWINVVQGEESSKALGFNGQWHVLRNWPEERRVSYERESEFFETTAWKEVAADKRGAKALGERVRERLFSKLKEQLPHMEESLRQELEKVDARLMALGGAESDSEKVESFRSKLDEIKQQATAYSKAHYDYHINHHFSGDLENPFGLQAKTQSPKSAAFLRSRIEDEGDQFRESIERYGHAWESIISPLSTSPFPDLAPIGNSKRPTPKEWTSWTKKPSDMAEETEFASRWLQERRGDASSWYLDPARIADYFQILSERWEKISEWHVDGMILYCQDYCKLMVPDGLARKLDGEDLSGFNNSKIVAQRYLDEYVSAELEKRKENAMAELRSLNEDRKGRIICFDVSYRGKQREYDNKQDFVSNNKAILAQNEARKGEITTTHDVLGPRTYALHSNRFKQEDNLKFWACKFVHAANCYYEIARGRWVANVMTQVVDRHILRKFEQVFPKNLSDEEILKILEESPKTGREKKELKKKKKEIGQLLSVLKEEGYALF